MNSILNYLFPKTKQQAIVICFYREGEDNMVKNLKSSLETAISGMVVPFASHKITTRAEKTQIIHNKLANFEFVFVVSPRVYFRRSDALDTSAFNLGSVPVPDMLKAGKDFCIIRSSEHTLCNSHDWTIRELEFSKYPHGYELYKKFEEVVEARVVIFSDVLDPVMLMRLYSMWHVDD
tara:strand:- start:182 stop:715 length:534 start_codon:yes stop_codon:yes gene_type:complete